MKRERAVAVGNRAGMVEWANAGWSRVTGYALEDAIEKPIADLLGLAGIGPDVIDFVRRRFERGESCEIELPLDPPDGERRLIRVSVESLCDRHGEVSHFAAIAWDVSENIAPDLGAVDLTRARVAEASSAAVMPKLPEVTLTSTDLSRFVAEVVDRRGHEAPSRTAFDLDLPDRLPWVGLDRDRVEDALGVLLDDASQAIGSEWGTVSVSTGLARNDAVFVSPTYPRNCLLRGLEAGLYGYVEIHDTGPPVDRTVIEVLAAHGRTNGVAGRTAGLVAARLLLQAHGGRLRLDADPGFGTRVILLFPC